MRNYTQQLFSSNIELMSHPNTIRTWTATLVYGDQKIETKGEVLKSHTLNDALAEIENKFSAVVHEGKVWFPYELWGIDKEDGTISFRLNYGLREDKMLQKEQCREIIFHFNKGHLQDPSIPMWTIKAKGQTFYINHLDADIPFSTKETPDNPSTKGSIKFRNATLEIDENGNAKISS